MNTVMVNAQAAFHAITAEVAAIIERRDNLIVTTQAELAAIGIESIVVKQCTAYPLHEGERVSLWRDHHRAHVNINVGLRSQEDDRWGPYAFNSLWVSEVIGMHTVLIADDDKALLVADTEPTEAQFSRAVARVRRLAKSELMRVRVQDRAVTLVSPMGDVVHEGDVVSAFCWISGIDHAAASR